MTDDEKNKPEVEGDSFESLILLMGHVGAAQAIWIDIKNRLRLELDDEEKALVTSVLLSMCQIYSALDVKANEKRIS